MSGFSLEHPYVIKQMGDENIENHQLGDIVFVCHQILKTGIKKMWRIKIFSLEE